MAAIASATTARAAGGETSTDDGNAGAEIERHQDSNPATEDTDTEKLSRILKRKSELLAQLRQLDAEEAVLKRHVADSKSDPPTRKQGSVPEPAARAQEQISANGEKDTAGSSKESDFGLHKGFVGSCSMSAEEVNRYSRQMLLPAFGIEAQERLRRSSVLVIGAGGLGCPIALYLTGAGVGRLGIVDRDTVESSNLHRQVIHTEARVGHHKVDSAAEACRALNSHVSLELYREGLTPSNALEIVDRYDVIVDASDNVTSRYLINDAAVAAGKPLVFGAALGVEGQVTVYHHKDGPCYRCLFPVPPPAAACQRCSEAGVLGVVPGVIGLLQAVEAVKLCSGVGEPLSARMLHYDALSARFLQVKLRGRAKDCAVCGDNPEVSRSNLALFPYEGFTSSPFHDKGPVPIKLLSPQEQISPQQLNQLLSSQERVRPLILDVRPKKYFQLASLPGSLGVPLSELEDKIPIVWAALAKMSQEASGKKTLIVSVCRRGNDSQRAAVVLKDLGFQVVLSLSGGLHAWSQVVDAKFPVL